MDFQGGVASQEGGVSSYHCRGTTPQRNPQLSFGVKFLLRLSMVVFVHAFEASVCCSLRFIARPFGNAQNCILEGRGLLGLL